MKATTLFFSLYLLASINYAQTTIFFTTSNRLFSIDPNSCVVDTIGDPGYEFSDIAYNPIDRFLYGIDYAGMLYRIDPTNAQSSAIGHIEITNSLTFDKNGLLYGYQGGGPVLGVFTYDIVSGNSNFWSTSLKDVHPSGDLSFFHNKLYVSTAEGYLKKINLTNNDVYTTVSQDTIWNTAYGVSSIVDGCHSTMYAFSKNNMYEIDSVSFASTLKCSNICSGYIGGSASVSESLESPVAYFDTDLLLCNNNPLLLDQTITYALYRWQDGSTNPTFSVTQPGKYWVTIQKNGCTTSDTINIASSCPDINLGPDKKLCPEQDITLDITCPLDSIYYTNYDWSILLLSPMSYSNLSQFTITQPHIYIATRTIGNCTSTDSISISADPFPSLYLGPDRYFCQKEIFFPPIYSLDDSIHYTWQDNSTDSSLRISKPGKYWLTINDQFCSSSDTIYITQNPTLQFNLGNDTVLCENQILEVGQFSSKDILSYSWQDGSINSTYKITKEGIYWLKITDLNHCSNSDTIYVQSKDCSVVLEMPTLISPNMDGYNDLFIPIILKNITITNTKVYNRWGEKIFTTDNPNVEWNSIDFTDGVYYWTMDCKDLNGSKLFKKGWVEVLR